MKKTLALIILLRINIFYYCGGSRINEPPIKTFEQHGIIFDCVDFYKQPAFDNPLLKNHSIQRKPSKAFEKSETYRRLEAAERNELTKGLEGCPEGSVPIRRVAKEDIQLNLVDPSDHLNPKTHLAVLYKSIGGFKAVRGKIGINNPQCVGNQLTASYVALLDNSKPPQNNMYAGWVKYPQLYRDDRPHLSIFWSNKAQGKGCFDVLCPGFVQVDTTVSPGNYFEHASIFHGDASEVQIEIRQDAKTKNWWFVKSGISVGYWPKELFSNFDGGAGAIFYGGIAIEDENHVSPQMGFGAKPSGALDESGYIRYMEFDGFWSSLKPRRSQTVVTSSCYQLQDMGTGNINGYIIAFGGPGGPGCAN